MKNILKILSLNDIAIYDYTTLSYINNNNYYINNLLNSYDYDYYITIDYANNQLDIDLYQSHNILYNIHIDNKDASNLFIDAILNDNNLNCSIIKINKYAITFE